MAFYRKKPVVIEAFQMTAERMHDNTEWPSWLNEAWQKDPETSGCFSRRMVNMDHCFFIYTLEGEHKVTINDFIIKGINGELYPCKPDIFVATYEAVGASVVKEAATGND